MALNNDTDLPDRQKKSGESVWSQCTARGTTGKSHLEEEEYEDRGCMRAVVESPEKTIVYVPAGRSLAARSLILLAETIEDESDTQSALSATVVPTGSACHGPWQERIWTDMDALLDSEDEYSVVLVSRMRRN